LFLLPCRCFCLFCRYLEARKSSEWSAWFRDVNTSSSDVRSGYSEERYRCTCQAEVSHASQLREPIIKRTRRVCSDIHGCTAGNYCTTAGRYYHRISVLVCWFDRYDRCDFRKVQLWFSRNSVQMLARGRVRRGGNVELHHGTTYFWVIYKFNHWVEGVC